MEHQSQSTEGYVYIIKFSAPLGNPDKKHGQAQYYIGWALDVEERLAEHRAGRGAAITRAAVERGISFDVVMKLPGTRTDERRLKNRKETPRIVSRHLAKQARAQAQ